MPARFAPEARFKLTSAPTVPFRGTENDELGQLKRRLLLQLLDESRGDALSAPLCPAANEAATLAWTTSSPLRVFPLLLEELAAVAQLRTLRQQRICDRSRYLLTEAV